MCLPFCSGYSFPLSKITLTPSLLNPFQGLRSVSAPLRVSIRLGSQVKASPEPTCFCMHRLACAESLHGRRSSPHSEALYLALLSLSHTVFFLFYHSAHLDTLDTKNKNRSQLKCLMNTKEHSPETENPLRSQTEG